MLQILINILEIYAMDSNQVHLIIIIIYTMIFRLAKIIIRCLKNFSNEYYG